MAKKEETQNGQELALTESVKGELANYFGGTVPQQEGIEFRFATLKIAHQNQAWELPDGIMEKFVKGVILHIQNVKAWWEIKFNDSGGGSPPDCSSLDGIRPLPTSNMIQANTCRECKWNVFGSDGKRGKGCKDMKRVYLKMDGYDLPVKIVVPPTSLRAINEYGSLLANRSLQYLFVETQFNLKKATNKDGIGYSELAPVATGPSARSKEEADKLIELKKNMLPLMKEEQFRPEEEYPVE